MAMNNDETLLHGLLEKQHSLLASDMSDSEYFQIFVSEQILKDRDLSYDELQDGIVDGGGDGGIDGVFFFVNGLLYREEVDYREVSRNVPLELVFVQAKRSGGFSEAGMDRFISSAKDLLDLSKDHLSSLTTVYKADLLGKIKGFRDAHLALVTKFPELSVRYYYAALSSEVHPNVDRKREQLREIVQASFNPVEFSLEFLRVQDLLGLTRRSPDTAHRLKLAENPISTGQEGFVCLVSLADYYKFIRSEGGSLKENIFEGNVRDYQGNTEVNQQIRETLTSPPGEDFWWLNNGISIICTSVTNSGKTLTIKNAEVVNGLQTSREIFEVFSQPQENTDDRSVLVRVLVFREEESRDRIIKATNSQTSIPHAALRATDKIHRNIEDYLKAGGRGLYYDRRKNYYKNQGKPVKKIIGIPFMAQSVLACVLRDPANARARPSSLLKNNDTYQRIFNVEHPLDIYFKSASLTRRVEDVLRSDTSSIERSHWNNLRYYVAMLVALRLIGLPVPSEQKAVQKVADIDLSAATNAMIADCISEVWGHYSVLGATDQVAKGNQLCDRVLDAHKAST